MLTRFDPFKDFDQLVDQLVPRGNVEKAMPLDIARGPDGYVVHADLPGVKPESIDLSVEGNVLTIRAERAWARADDLEVLAAERPKGSFVRQLTIGDGFDMERVSAAYEDGVLTVVMPVSEASKPRKIAVSPSARESERTIEASSS